MLKIAAVWLVIIVGGTVWTVIPHELFYW